MLQMDSWLIVSIEYPGMRMCLMHPIWWPNHAKPQTTFTAYWEPPRNNLLYNEHLLKPYLPIIFIKLSLGEVVKISTFILTMTMIFTRDIEYWIWINLIEQIGEYAKKKPVRTGKHFPSTLWRAIWLLPLEVQIGIMRQNSQGLTNLRRYLCNKTQSSINSCPRQHYRYSSYSVIKQK